MCGTVYVLTSAYTINTDKVLLLTIAIITAITVTHSLLLLLFLLLLLLLLSEWG